MVPTVTSPIMLEPLGVSGGQPLPTQPIEEEARQRDRATVGTLRRKERVKGRKAKARSGATHDQLLVRLHADVPRDQQALPLGKTLSRVLRQRSLVKR